jgi:hypothetical protein
MLVALAVDNRPNVSSDAVLRQDSSKALNYLAGRRGILLFAGPVADVVLRIVVGVVFPLSNFQVRILSVLAGSASFRDTSIAICRYAERISKIMKKCACWGIEVTKNSDESDVLGYRE